MSLKALTLGAISPPYLSSKVLSRKILLYGSWGALSHHQEAMASAWVRLESSRIFDLVISLTQGHGPDYVSKSSDSWGHPDSVSNVEITKSGIIVVCVLDCLERPPRGYSLCPAMVMK